MRFTALRAYFLLALAFVAHVFMTSSAFATIQNVESITTKSAGDRFMADEFNYLTNVNRKIFRDDADTASDFSDDILGLGIAIDPVSGSCPSGTTHIDYDDDSTIDNGECFQGVRMGNTLFSPTDEFGLHFPTKIAVQAICDLNGDNCSTPASLASGGGGGGSSGLQNPLDQNLDIATFGFIKDSHEFLATSGTDPNTTIHLSSKTNGTGTVQIEKAFDGTSGQLSVVDLLSFARTKPSFSVQDGDGYNILFQHEDSAGNEHDFARLQLVANDITDATEDGTLTFGVASAGTLEDALSIRGSGTDTKVVLESFGTATDGQTVDNQKSSGILSLEGSYLQGGPTTVKSHAFTFQNIASTTALSEGRLAIGWLPDAGSLSEYLSITSSGNVRVHDQGDLLLGDSDSSNFVGFQAPATVSSDLTWTLPASDGTSGQVLSTDGSGTLSWVSNSGGGGSMGIGESVSSGTSGSLLFIDSASNLAQDNSSLFWDNANNRLGILTTSPGSALDVQGSLRLSGSTSGFVGFSPAAEAGSTTYTLPSADGTSGQVLTTDGAGTLTWADDDTGAVGIGDSISSGTSGSALFIDSAGNLAQDNSNFFWDNENNRLGVGTTTPSSALQVSGTVTATGLSVSGGSVSVNTVDYTFPSSDGTSGQVLTTAGDGTLTWADDDTGAVSIGDGIGSGTSGSLLFIDSASNLAQDNSSLFWDNANNRLGILTTSPGSALDVQGSLRLSGSTSGFVGFSPAAEAGSTTYTLPSADGTSGQVLTTDGAGTLTWADDDTGAVGIGDSISSGTSGSALFIDSAGNLAQDNSNFFWDNENNRLGVGTTTPSSALQVSGTVTATGLSVSGGSVSVNTVDYTFPSSDGTSGQVLTTAGDGTLTWADDDVGTLNIGDSVGSGTSGSLLFIDSASNLAQDNSNIFWDNVNNRLGVGTTTPSTELHVAGDILTDAQGELRLGDSDSTNYVGLRAPTTVGSDLIWTLPTTDGASNAVLTTNGGGALSWTDTLAVSQGGTGRTSFTSGSILFSNGSILAQDNSNFFWNDITNRLGVGTSSPGESIEASGAIKIGSAASTADGTIQWTGTDFLARKEGAWVSLTAGASGGEENTASNVGTAGVGVFKQKTAVDLEFKNINAGSNKITITDDTDDDEIDIDVAEANLDITNMSGTLALTQGGTGATTASAARTNLGLGTLATQNSVDISNHTNLTGTADRITLTDDTLNIATSYVGQTSITTLGTVSTGTWEATTIALDQGGTGATTASAARTNLGLAIGSDVQAFDAQLTDVAGLTPADGAFILGDGANFVTESGNTARTSLGLGTSDSPTFAGITIDSAAITQILDEDTLSSNSASALATQQSIKAYVDSQVTSGGLAIGNVVGSGTANSVLFIDSAGNLGQSNTNLYWDGTNNRLGIGTNTPAQVLDITGTTTSTRFQAKVLSDKGTCDSDAAGQLVYEEIDNEGFFYACKKTGASSYAWVHIQNVD